MFCGYRKQTSIFPVRNTISFMTLKSYRLQSILGREDSGGVGAAIAQSPSRGSDPILFRIWIVCFVLVLIVTLRLRRQRQQERCHLIIWYFSSVRVSQYVLNKCPLKNHFQGLQYHYKYSLFKKKTNFSLVFWSFLPSYQHQISFQSSFILCKRENILTTEWIPPSSVSEANFILTEE